MFFGFATAQTIWFFVALNALNGLCRSFFEPSTQALMIDFTPADKRKRLYSFRYTAINIAAVIGPIIGVYISQLSSPSIPFMLTGTMYIIYAVFLFFVLNRYEMQQPKASTPTKILQTFTILLTNRVLLSFIFGAILINIGYSQFDSTLPQIIELKIEIGGWLLTHYMNAMFAVIAVLVLCSCIFYRSKLKPQ